MQRHPPSPVMAVLRHVLPAIVACLAVAALPARADLDALVAGGLWQTPAEAFEQAVGIRGEWTHTDDSRTLRLRRPALDGTPVAEAIVQFSPGGLPLRAQILLYSRGDDGPLVGRDFVDRVTAVQARLDGLAGAPGTRRHVPATSSLAEIHSWEWSAPHARYRLDAASEGSASKRRGEFIRLWVVPPAAAAAADPRAPAQPATLLRRPTAAPSAADRSSRRDTVKKDALLANIVRSGTAVTISNIPMVNQGDKGYCAAAVVSRLLAYYGIATVDQHELAAAMGTSAEGGTTAAATKDAMAACGRNFGLRLADIDELDYRDYERLVKEYNSAARHRGTPRIENRGGMPVVGEPFWQLADGPTLRDARAETPQKQRQWLRKIKDAYLDKGIPVVWGVYCGLLPEEGPATPGRGGHLRLLVGYDEAKGLVYFSDTWGPGHECKPMPLADAIAITRSRFALFPVW
jgi:hypothetical protein